MNILNIRDLRKSYGSRMLLDDVAFAIDEGEKVGYIGANGCGKSTLFRIVAGLEGMEAGVVALRRGATVGYLPQEPEFPPGQTVREIVAAGHPEMQAAVREYEEIASLVAAGDGDNARLLARQDALTALIDALGGWDWRHRVEAMLTRVGLDDPDRPAEVLSGGELKRAALARVLLRSPDLLLLDEPTNHLDADTTLWLEEYLLDYPGAVMLITHDRYFLDRVVTRMLEIEAGAIAAFTGGYTEYLEAKEAERERLAIEDEKRARLLADELAWVRRSPAARTGKQKARIKRLDDAVRKHAERRGPEREVTIRFGDPPRLGRSVLDVEGLSKSFGDRVLIRDFGRQLRAGERIGVVGPNGAGKTTLLQILLGEVEPDEGTITWGRNTRAAYFDQKRQDLDPADTLIEAVAGDDWVVTGGRRVHVRSYLESFLFPTAVQDQKVSSLSGGERNRLLLARLLLRDANLLVLDEPTNDLDLVTLRVLESALAEFPGCVLVVTHDRYFLDRVATGLLVFEGGGTVRSHEGGYDLYRRLREERESARAQLDGASEPAPARSSRPVAGSRATRRISYREKQELEKIEAVIVEAEERQKALEASLADPALYSDTPERIAEITEAYHTATKRVNELYARWGELDEIASGRPA